MGIVTAVEPSERFAHPRNAALLEHLKKTAVKGKGDGYDLDGYQLHTHPDLGDHLQALNRACYEGAYGTPVLANDRGISCVTVDYDVLRGLDSPDDRLF